MAGSWAHKSSSMSMETEGQPVQFNPTGKPMQDKLLKRVNIGDDKIISEHNLLWIGLSRLRFKWRLLIRPPNSPDLNSIEHSWDGPHKQVWSMLTPLCNLQHLQDLLLMSWCQTPQNTELWSDPSRDQSCFSGTRGTESQGGFNVMADRCPSLSRSYKGLK